MNISQQNLATLNGILIIVFGLVALFFPGVTLAALGIYFAITILIGGLMLSVSSLRMKKTSPKWYLFLTEGIIGIIIGLIILTQPELVATVFVVIIGIWAIILGLIILFTYLKTSLPALPGAFLLMTSIASLIMGVLIIINPFESTRVITILIGIYAIIYGVFSVMNSIGAHR